MSFLLFLAAASIIALSPGPGIFYVAARTLADGRGVGLASSLGTGIGGLVHVAAGAVGVSALILASAEAFTILKIAGALYLVWLGIKTAREARLDIVAAAARRKCRPGLSRRHLRRGPEPQDGRLLPRLPAAVRRSGPGRGVAAVLACSA